MKRRKLSSGLFTAGLLFAIVVFILPVYGSYGMNRLFKSTVSHKKQKIPNDAFTSMQKKLADAYKLTPEGKVSYRRFYLTEDELNAYVQLNYGEKISAEIKSWQVKLDRDEALILVLINLDEFREVLKDELSSVAKMLLRGEVTLRVWGNFYGSNGVGKFEIKAIRLGFLPIPVSLVKRMIVSKSSEEDSEIIDKGFPLPDGFHSVTLAGSRVIIN